MAIVVEVDNAVLPPDDTSWPDWFLFSLLCVGYALAGSLCALVLSRRAREYLPLQSKQRGKLLAMCAFGAVHWTATFLANDHLPLGTRQALLSPPTCVLFSFWMQYAVGVGGWMCVLFLRIIEYAMAFYPGLRKLQGAEAALKRRRLQWCVLLWTALPVLLICLVASLAPGAVSFSEELGTCSTALPVKGGLLIWLALQCGTLAFVNLRVSGGVRDAYLSEYAPLRDILVWGLCTLISNAALNLSGALVHVWGRFVFGCFVLALHLFTLARLYGYRAWKCLRGDQHYVLVWLSSYSVYDLRLSHVRQLLKVPTLLEDFLSFCESTSAYRGRKLATCYRQLRGWRELADLRTEAMFRRILDTYYNLDKSPDTFVHFPAQLTVSMLNKRGQDRLRLDVFDGCASWLLDELNRCCGKSYFDSDTYRQRLLQVHRLYAKQTTRRHAEDEERGHASERGGGGIYAAQTGVSFSTAARSMSPAADAPAAGAHEEPTVNLRDVVQPLLTGAHFITEFGGQAEKIVYPGGPPKGGGKDRDLTYAPPQEPTPQGQLVDWVPMTELEERPDRRLV